MPASCCNESQLSLRCSTSHCWAVLLLLSMSVGLKIRGLGLGLMGCECVCMQVWERKHRWQWSRGDHLHTGFWHPPQPPGVPALAGQHAEGQLRVSTSTCIVALFVVGQYVWQTWHKTCIGSACVLVRIRSCLDHAGFSFDVCRCNKLSLADSSVLVHDRCHSREELGQTGT